MIRLALIGLGNIARRHAEVAKALLGCELVAGVKRSEETGRVFCREYGIPRFYSSTAALIEAGDFDAAVVCVGHLSTVEVAKAVLATGRPCLVEKPVGFSSAETMEVAEVARNAGTWGMVAVNRRFYGNVRRARELVADAGGLKAIRVEHTEWMHQAASWGLPEAVLDRFLFVNGIHLVDLMCHLAGLPVQSASIVCPAPDRRHAFDALLQFPSGAVGHYSAQWYAPGRWAVDLFARDLRVAFPFLEQGTVQRPGGQPEPISPDPLDEKFKPGFYLQMQTFLEAVATGSPPSPPACLLEESAAVMRVLEGLGITSLPGATQ